MWDSEEVYSHVVRVRWLSAEGVPKSHVVWEC